MTPLSHSQHRHRTGAAIALSALLALATSAPVLADSSGDVKRLGGVNSAICRPALRSGADMQKFFATRRADVDAILAAAGWNGNPEDLYKAVQAGQYKEVSVPVGAKFKWMGMREKKKIVAKPDRRWAGKNPFAAYEVEVVSKGAKHKFVVPKPCCNLALVSSEALPPPPPPPAPVAVPPPAPVAAPAPAKAAWLPFVAPFIGVIERNFPDPLLVGAGAGVLHPLNPDWDMLVQLGVGYDDEHSHTSLFAEIGALRKVGNGYFGGGVGAWDITDSDLFDGTIWLEAGLNTPWKVSGTPVQWFVNGRVFWEELDNIDDNFTLSTGLRIFFGGR
jgi:hypothetical protein